MPSALVRLTFGPWKTKKELRDYFSQFLYFFKIVSVRPNFHLKYKGKLGQVRFLPSVSTKNPAFWAGLFENLIRRTQCLLLGKRDVVDENGTFLWARIDIVKHNDELIKGIPILDLAELLEWDGDLLPLIRDTTYDIS